MSAGSSASSASTVSSNLSTLHGIGPFLGALAGELLSGRGLPDSARGGFGALLGALVAMFAKIGLTVLMIGLFLWWIWRG